jgi:vancomycin resistance protein YoaR
MTSATFPQRLRLPVLGRRFAGRSFLLGLSVGLAAGFVLIAAASVAVAATSQGLMLPQVTVAGVDVGGLDRSAAKERLEATLPSLSAGQATLVVGEDEATVAYADVGRGYELDGMLSDAYAVGRGGNPYTDTIARLRALTVGVSLPVEVHAYDADALDAAVAGTAEAFRIEAADASVSRTGTEFAVAPSTTGRAVSEDAIRAALEGSLVTTDPSDVTLTLEAEVIAPAISTADAETAAAAATAMTADLELTVPGAGEDEEALTIGAETIAGWISFGPSAGSPYAAQLDEAAAATAIEALAETVDREARNAGFTIGEGGGLAGIVPAEEGRALNVDESTDALLATLGTRAAGGAPVPALALAVDVTEPDLTTAEAEEALPHMTMVSGWTTNYPAMNNGSAYNPNIVIPANDVDGTLLMPGEEFSFWGGIGPVTVERGFTYGGVIINGRSVADGALAGGICSTSTTLFNAALRYGLEMGDRLNHYYYIDRYPTGLDATVYTDGTWTQDMTFTNDTAHPIVIRGFGGPGWVRFEIWTVHDGRTVAFSDTVTSNHRTATDTTQVSSSLAPGQAQRTEYPHNGFDASVWRWVYDADGNLLHENHYFSSYRAVNGVTLVGPTASAPAPRDEDDDEDEEPPAGDPPPSPAP